MRLDRKDSCDHAAHDKTRAINLPNHSGKEVKKGLLTAILKQAQIKTTKR